MVPHYYETTVAGRKLCVESGKLAEQAQAAVTVRYGDTMVLVTCCVAPEPKEGVDFLPLTIEYQERLYAAGKIPGGFIRREGRPSEDAILTSRVTDRPLRPLLPKTWRRDIQVVVTVLSTDRDNDPDLLSIFGSSLTLGMSCVPFAGPVGACRIGYINGEFIINPTLSEMPNSEMDLVVASTSQDVCMIEAGMKEVPENIVLEAIRRAHEANQEIIRFQEMIIKEIGLPKEEAPVIEHDPELVNEVIRICGDDLRIAMSNLTKATRAPGCDAIKKKLIEELGEKWDPSEILDVFDKRIKFEIRNCILTNHVRLSGRKLNQVRPITTEVDLIPRVHGSSLFTRGETQVLNIATLGSLRDNQKLDGLGIEESKRYIHHYNMPPYANGEAKKFGVPGRREIGHGALAERALLPVIPSEEEFPYTIRLVSEVLSSSGSTSMASTCASTMSLMAAGVPIKRMVGGISMGLITGDNGEFEILTDIEGMEDNYGDMDFKVAGTMEGITALQLDIKIHGITMPMIEKTIWQGREAREHILGKMREAISEPRTELSPYAPRMYKTTVDPDKIGAIIGPGGKTIRAITDETKTTIDISNDGTVVIGATDAAMADKALKMIQELGREVKIGEIFTGRVNRIEPFGAFVELVPGKDGLCHISELDIHRVGKVEDIVKLGEDLTVKVIRIDAQGKISVSRKALLDPDYEAEDRPRKQYGRPAHDTFRFDKND